MAQQKVSERIRKRILKELQMHRQIIQDESLVDEVLEATIDHIDDLVKRVVAELVTQRVALGKRAELREMKTDIVDKQADSVTVALNLNEMRWDDVDFMVEHLTQAKEGVLRRAIEVMPSGFIDDLGRMIEGVIKNNEQDGI